MFYHVWFVTKYRKVTIEGDLEKFVKHIFAECIQRHGYNVLELETNKDHVHMLVEAVGTPRFRVGNSAGTKEYPTRQCGDVARHFWARRYGCREIGDGEIESMREYIRNQKKRHAKVGDTTHVSV